MNAKTKIEAVPSPAQLLREAIARRDSISGEMTKIEEKLKFLAPIQEEEASAQGALKEVMRRDAEAMQTWMNEGAQGDAPEPDKTAREEAIHKLGQASAKLQAAGNVRAKIEAEHASAHARRMQAEAAIKAAEGQVLADEYLRSARALKDAYLSQIKAEHHFEIARSTALTVNNAMANTVAGKATDIVMPLTIGQMDKLARETYQLVNQRLAALRAGIDPEDAP